MNRPIMMCVVIAMVWMNVGLHDAAADRYEASVSLRPLGAVGRITEHIADASGGNASVASVYGVGGEIGLMYGLRNWLDVGGEFAGAGFAQAIYDPATVAVTGSTTTGRLTRTTRLVQLRAGATLRFGVGWVPTIHLGLGVGGRALTAAMLRDKAHAHTVVVTPDDMAARLAIDVIASLRVGIEHRLDRRWGVGLGAEATHAVGLGTPPLEVVSASMSLSYTWYPLL